MKLQRPVLRWIVLLILIGLTLAPSLYSRIGRIEERSTRYAYAWGLLGVESLVPIFADLRGVLGPAECRDLGTQLYSNNPCDPWGRPFNYPRIWLALSFLGLGRADVPIVGLCSVLGFLFGCFFLMRGVTRFAALYWALCLSSPAILLAIERGNCDLIIFGLLCVALHLCSDVKGAASRSWGLVAVGAATVLKLFPVVSFLVILKAPPRRFAALALGITAIIGSYFFLTWSDIQRISAATQQSAISSYGLINLAQSLRLASNAGVISMVGFGAFLICAALTWYWRKHLLDIRGDVHGFAVDGLRIGAPIFCITYLVHSHFQYRLIFTLFTLPYLFELGFSQRHGRWIARAALSLMLGVLWGERVEALQRIAFDEWCGLFFALCLVSLLTLSVPQWMANLFDQGIIRRMRTRESSA